VLNAVARVVSGTKKFERGLTHLMHAQLHWLDSPDRVSYKTTTMVYWCIHGQSPQYLVDCCTPVTDLATRRHLRSVRRHLLAVQRYWLYTYGRRAFSVAAPRSGIHCRTVCEIRN